LAMTPSEVIQWHVDYYQLSSFESSYLFFPRKVFSKTFIVSFQQGEHTRLNYWTDIQALCRSEALSLLVTWMLLHKSRSFCDHARHYMKTWNPFSVQ